LVVFWGVDSNFRSLLQDDSLLVLSGAAYGLQNGLCLAIRKYLERHAPDLTFLAYALAIRK
jgi:hypothetical protein